MSKNDESSQIGAWYIEATNYKQGLIDEKKIWMYTKQFKWKEAIA